MSRSIASQGVPIESGNTVVVTFKSASISWRTMESPKLHPPRVNT